MNQIYREVKVPHSFARSIRDFSDLPHWKANEYKVFMFYTGVSALINIPPNPYFEHFCLYVMIMRKLCDRNLDLESDEIENLEKLLIFWHKGIERYYDIFELTFTAHAHLHLPHQVVFDNLIRP